MMKLFLQEEKTAPSRYCAMQDDCQDDHCRCPDIVVKGAQVSFVGLGRQLKILLSK